MRNKKFLALTAACMLTTTLLFTGCSSDKKEAALKAFDKYLQETNYKSTDVPKTSGETFGLCYGEYTEQRRNGKVVKIKEKAKDFFGNTKVLKVINT